VAEKIKETRQRPVCPRCGAPTRRGARYCGHCGVSLRLWDVTWSLRRSVGGAIAGGAGWVFGLGLTRLFSDPASLTFPHPLFACLVGLFIGAAGGLMERSFGLMWKGMVAGGLGGVVAGIFGNVLAHALSSVDNGYLAAHAVLWCLVGLMVSTVSTRERMWALLGGLLFGALGGALNWSFSVAMTLEMPQPVWYMARGVEFTNGAILGALIWGGMAFFERWGLQFERRRRFWI